jgi:hypothetical protein
VNKRTLQRRVRINEKCYDQIINLYTGAVEQQTPASCKNRC